MLERCFTFKRQNSNNMCYFTSNTKLMRRYFVKNLSEIQMHAYICAFPLVNGKKRTEISFTQK